MKDLNYANKMKDLNYANSILKNKVKKHSECFAICQCHYVVKVFKRFEHLKVNKQSNTH